MDKFLVVPLIVYVLPVYLYRSSPRDDPKKNSKKTTYKIPKKSTTEKERLIRQIFGQPTEREAQQEALRARLQPPSSRGHLQRDTSRLRTYHSRLREGYQQYEKEVQAAIEACLAYCDERAGVLEAKKRKWSEEAFAGLIGEDGSPTATCKPQEKPAPRNDDHDRGNDGDAGPSSSSSVSTSSTTENAVSI